MNKRYMSLLLLSTAVSGTKAMELGDVAPAEELKDKYALLKPRLTQTEREQLEYTVNSIGYEAHPTRVQILEAYDAVVQLEADEAPDARTVAAQRKNLWTMLKAAPIDEKGTLDVEAARRDVNYLTGSESEVEGDETAKLNHMVSRVKRRDGHMTAQSLTLSAHKKAETTLNAQEEKLAQQQAALLAVKQPLDADLEKQNLAEEAFKATDASIVAKQAAIERLVDYTLEVAKEEPTLAGTAREQLYPTCSADIAKEKADVANQLAAVIVAKQALDGKIAPVTAQLAEIAKTQAETKKAQEELAQLLAQAEKAQTLAKTDREKILLTLDQRIEVTAESKKTLLAEVADLTKKAYEEKKVEAKATLQSDKTAKDAETKKVADTLANLRIARAKADGTYSTVSYYAGTYHK